MERRSGESKAAKLAVIFFRNMYSCHVCCSLPIADYWGYLMVDMSDMESSIIFLLLWPPPARETWTF
jgi:hypothetical protein